jgi:FdhE protein
VESRLRTRIAALSEAEPALADDLALRGALIEIVDLADLGSVELRLPANVARARLAAGVPLLDRLDLPIPPATSALLDRLTVAMLADSAVSEPAQAMLAALRKHRLHAEQLVGEAIVGHEDHLAALAASADLPSALVDSVADLTARAVLSTVARRLRPALSLATWDRGYCPICGGRAVFGERVQSDSPVPRTEVARVPREGETSGRLHCGRCATSWAHTLLRCPDCHTGRLAVVDMSDAADLDDWTLAGCDACRAYLKLAPSPRSERLADLLVDDLTTWQLDRVALEFGYARQAGTGYRLEHGEPAGEELDDD